MISYLGRANYSEKDYLTLFLEKNASSNRQPLFTKFEFISEKQASRQ